MTSQDLGNFFLAGSLFYYPYSCFDKHFPNLIGQLPFICFFHTVKTLKIIHYLVAAVIMTIHDRIMLRKRSIIETINDELKNICQIEHSRHRSFVNFITNLISGLLAYSFLPKKPSIKYETQETYGQLALF